MVRRRLSGWREIQDQWSQCHGENSRLSVLSYSGGIVSRVGKATGTDRL